MNPPPLCTLPAGMGSAGFLLTPLQMVRGRAARIVPGAAEKATRRKVPLERATWTR
jgi:hypothetical protein